MDHPIPGLKYVDAGDLKDGGSQFAGVNVTGLDGEKLGEVEGFIMDVPNGRPRHIAVGAGWFIHKHFLLPIGDAMLAPDGTSLVAKLTKERVNLFPGFDKSEFERLTTDEMHRFDVKMAEACASDMDSPSSVEDHYRLPDWWKSKPW